MLSDFADSAQPMGMSESEANYCQLHKVLHFSVPVSSTKQNKKKKIIDGSDTRHKDNKRLMMRLKIITNSKKLKKHCHLVHGVLGI